MIGYILAAVIVAAALYWFNYETGTKTNAPTVPGSLPIIHETLLMLQNWGQFDDFLVDLSKKLGLTFTVKLIGQARMILTSDPANVEHMLKGNFDNYVKGDLFNDRVGSLLGRGIFNSDGASWKSQRKITSNLFSLKGFRDNIHGVLEKHCGYLVDIVETSIKNDTPVDVNNVFHRFTLDSIGQIAFGYDIGSLKDKDVPFARAWDDSTGTVMERFFTANLTLKQWFSPSEWRVLGNMKIVNDFTKKIINERKHESPEAIAARGDLLSLFMTRTDENDKPFTEDFLVDMVKSAIIAGRDTTAQSLCWTVYLLCNNPDKLKKVRAELDEVLGDQPPSFEDVRDHKLKYLYATITESLRLYPSVPRDGKTAVANDVLPDGTVVPKGTLLVYLPYVMGRTEKLWGPDCLEFKPERFLDDVHPSQYKFTAFQGGYRRCLGVDLAYHEEQVVLATLLQRFDISLVPGQDIQMAINITATLNGPLLIKFTPRQH